MNESDKLAYAIEQQARAIWPIIRNWSASPWDRPNLYSNPGKVRRDFVAVTIKLRKAFKIA